MWWPWADDKFLSHKVIQDQAQVSEDIMFPCLWGQSKDGIIYASKDMAVWSLSEWCSAHPSWFSQDSLEFQLCFPEIVSVIDTNKLSFWFIISGIGHDLKVIEDELFLRSSCHLKMMLPTWSPGCRWLCSWVKWARCLHGTWMRMGLTHWPLVGGLLSCRSCSICLGTDSSPWYPYHCQLCDW